MVLVTIGCFLINAWIAILKESYTVKWQHLAGLLLFLPLPLLLFRSYKLAVLGTGIYLLLGLFRLLSLTAGVSTGFFTIAGLEISGFNWLPLGLLILFFILHLDVLIDMRLEYKERKTKVRIS